MGEKPIQNKYIYQIGHTSYEEGGATQFTHNEKFTKQQLMNIVEAIIHDIIRKCSKNEFNFTIGEILGSNDFINRMKKRGFAVLTFHEQISFWGWNSLLDKEWPETTKEETNMLERFRITLEKKNKMR